jgi:transcriptional/translational regulatory protein YebC/TACO1
MDSWWAELEVTLSVEIQDQHKAGLEALTGSNPLLLRPLLRPICMIPDLQKTNSDEHYAEVIEHLFNALEKSDEVSNVRNSIVAFVAAKHAKLTLEPVRWEL